ncbi:MAG: TonB family protein, partial [Bacteroidetes bacterium]|nr:TonB family protein [Bacteroidota bacterium]
PDLLFNNNRENNKSDSEGNDKSGNGDKGSEEGDPSSPNYEGSNIPGGSGIAYNLSGRTGNLPKPQYTSKEQGKVVVEIKVDRYGKVINAVPGAKGSTTHDKALWEAAKKAALNAKFNKKLDASEYQIGTITYTFILQ